MTLKLLSLISGGIDSPVAADLFLRKNVDLSMVIFDNSPFSSEDELDGAVELIEKLSDRHERDIEVFIVPNGAVQERFLNNCYEKDLSYSCLFNRRMMLRISQKIAEDNELNGLITGDSMGQVASQTLDNLSVIGSVSDLPVYRPLLGMDKHEIIVIAKEIGTFQLTAGRGISCAVNPDYPETHARLKRMRKIENEFPISEMVEERVKSTEKRQISV